MASGDVRNYICMLLARFLVAVLSQCFEVFVMINEPCYCSCQGILIYCFLREECTLKEKIAPAGLGTGSPRHMSRRRARLLWLRGSLTKRRRDS